MKTGTTTIILGVALLVVAGFFTATVTGLFSIQPVAQASKSTATGAYLTGHVTTIVTDSVGNVKEYRQSDNVITNGGENCVARLLFRLEGIGSSIPGNAVCTGALSGSWHNIAIGTSTTKANGSNTGLGSELSGSGLSRGAAMQISWSNSSGTTASTSAQAQLQRTFTNTGSSVQVTESGLFNSSTVGATGMFARQNFTAIGLGNGDSLTVVWTINIGGTQFTLAQ